MKNTNLVINIACALLSLLILLLLIFSGIFIYMSLSGNPGDDLHMMGVVMLSLPISFFSILLFIITLYGRKSIGTKLRAIYLSISCFFILIFISIFALG